jgi:hypothetical protein
MFGCSLSYRYIDSQSQNNIQMTQVMERSVLIFVGWIPHDGVLFDPPGLTIFCLEGPGNALMQMFVEG